MQFAKAGIRFFIVVLLAFCPTMLSGQKPDSRGLTVGQLRAIAEQGQVDAQNALGGIYLEGNGVPIDFGEAVHWFRKAADQGSAEGQVNLGFRYWRGEGVTQDYSAATVLFRKAAEQGDSQAQYVLGAAYRLGWGVRRDFVQAHMWLNLAASDATDEDRKEYSATRDKLALQMTRKQIAEAQRRARDWRPKPTGRVAELAWGEQSDAELTAQLHKEFPEIEADSERVTRGLNPESELFKCAGEIYRAAVGLDSTLKGSNWLLLMAARQARTEMKAGGCAQHGRK